MSKDASFVSVIKNPSFRYLWFNQILIQLAYNTLNYALLIWVFKLMDSSFAVSVLMLAFYLPSILFGLFAGVLVDLADRRKIILAVDLLLAGAFLIFPFIKYNYPLILLNAFFINTLSQFFMPSESSSIPMLVSRKQLFIANSLFSLTLYAAFMTGFSIGGPILDHFSIDPIFYGGSAVMVAAFLMSQRLPSLKTKLSHRFKNLVSPSSIKAVMAMTRGEIRETFGFIGGRLNVAAAIGLMSMVQGVIGTLGVMLPSYMERVLKIHATQASYFVIIPLGIGMILGALLVGRIGYGRSRRSVVVPAIVVAGVMFVIVGLIPAIAQLIQSADLPAHLTRPRFFFRAPSLSTFFGFIAFLLGFCLVSIIIPSQTVLQENTTGRNRGKIFAVLAVLMTAVSAVPVVLAGALSDIFGVAPIFAVLGFVVALAGVVVARPEWFFQEHHLPFAVREFLGLGHWEKVSKSISKHLLGRT